MKRLGFLTVIGMVLMATAGFFGCSETDNPVGGGSGDTLGTGTNPPSAEFAMAADILEEVGTNSGQTQLLIGMALVSDIMQPPKSPRRRPLLATEDGAPDIMINSSTLDGDWFVYDFSAILVDWEDTISVAGIDSIRFEAAQGGYTTQPDTTVTGFEIRSHLSGTYVGEDVAAATAFHGVLDFSGSVEGVLTINAASNDTVSLEADQTGCTYTVATAATWTDLVFDLASVEENDGPASGSLDLTATVSSSCGAGAPDSVQVDGQWTLEMTFGGGTVTITVGDGVQEWTFTENDNGGDSDTTGWPGDTGYDTTGDTTWPGDSGYDSTDPGDSGVYDYCGSLPQAELDSMKLWAYFDGPNDATDGSIAQVIQMSIEALQQFDTALADAFPFEAPLYNAQFATVSWDASGSRYIMTYNMQFTEVDSSWHDTTQYVDTSDIHVVGADTITVYSGGNPVSLPAAGIDSVVIRNQLDGTFIRNGMDTTVESTSHQLTVIFSSLDSSAEITVDGEANNQFSETEYDGYSETPGWCTLMATAVIDLDNVVVPYTMFLNMDESDGCPLSGTISSTVAVSGACVGEWYCDVDIVGEWLQIQAVDGASASESIYYTTGGLQWQMNGDCGGSAGSSLLPHVARR